MSAATTTTPVPRFLSYGVFSVLMALAISACGNKTQAGATDTSDYAVERTFERGPVKVVLRIDNDEPSIADRINLQLEVTSDESYEVKLPSFGEKLDQFGIVDYSTTQPELVDGGRTRQMRSYVLEPFLSGDYVIPPMKVTFKKSGDTAEADADAGAHELETEEVKIQVKSLLPEARADLKIHESLPPVGLPTQGSPGLWWKIGGTVAALLVALGLVLWLTKRGKTKESKVPQVPAHEIAFRQLEQLVAEDLPGKGEVKGFYQRISDILRHYIENRFGLRAPEQTTEEFLSALSLSSALDEPHKQLLKKFLEHCDLVKFAEHHPSNDDIQATFDACKHFIVETQANEITTPEPATEPAAPTPATA